MSTPAPLDVQKTDGARKPSWFMAVLPVAIVAACAELATAILNNSTLPVYYRDGLGISYRIFSLIMIPFYVSEALFKLPLGVLSDRYGRKPLMLGGALVTIFTPILLTMIHGIHHQVPLHIFFVLGLLRLADGLGGAALWPAVYAYIGDVVDEAKRGAALGLMNVVYMMGLALGFLAGGFVDDTFGPVFTHDATPGQQMGVMISRVRSAGHRFMQHFHPNRMHHGAPVHAPAVDPLMATLSRPGHYFPSFYLASLLFGIAACVILLLVRNARPRVSTIENHEAAITWADFMIALKKVPQFLVLAFVAFAGVGCIATLVKLFIISEFHITEKEVGILMLWPTLMIAAIALPVGILSDKWGKTRSVRLGFCLCTVGLWSIPVLHFMHVQQVGFVIAASLAGVGSVFAFPAWTALLTTLSTDKLRGTVIGAVSTAQGAGVLVGVAFGPSLVPSFGRIAPFIAAAVLVTIATVISLIYVREAAIEKCRIG